MPRTPGAVGRKSLEIVDLEGFRAFMAERRQSLGGEGRGSLTRLRAVGGLHSSFPLSNLVNGWRTVGSGRNRRRAEITGVGIQVYRALQQLAMREPDGGIQRPMTKAALARVEALERCVSWEGFQPAPQHPGSVWDFERAPAEPYGASKPRRAALRGWVSGRVVSMRKAGSWNPFPPGVPIRVDDVPGTEEKALAAGHTVAKYRGRVYVMGSGASGGKRPRKL